MKFIADFHIHSHFSRATSKDLTPEQLDHWAKIKGIQVVGTGDCLHPGWLSELHQKLESSENGLYRLKKEFQTIPSIPILQSKPVYFILSTEISTIYKKNGKVRKVHQVIVFPNFESAESLQAALSKIGNLTSDGRPILGLDSKILLNMMLELSPGAFMIPAHIWTPWFSVLGSQSGFDSISECFEELTPHIFAVETGLSSDPPMNRICSFLDSFRLVSNSDAHSPGNLGREANLFNAPLSYDGIYHALKDDNGFLGTIEFFAEEGKYHFDGHRKCNICWNPLETISHNGICPVCGKPITKGVMYRVAELADRSSEDIQFGNQSFYSITPLPELLSEIHQTKSTTSKGVLKDYTRLISEFGSEFDILLTIDPAEYKAAGFTILSEGIKRLRDGKIYIQSGFDGEYGRIRVFKEDEIPLLQGATLFAIPDLADPPQYHQNSVAFDVPMFQRLKKDALVATETQRAGSTGIRPLDSQAPIDGDGDCLVIAGPGSGKTRLLTERITHLIETKKATPNQILALTFSNKAAKEMKARIEKNLGHTDILVSTFHSFGLSVLTAHRPQKVERLLGKPEKETVAKSLFGKSVSPILAQIERYKQGLIASPDTTLVQMVEKYNQTLDAMHASDLEDLIALPVQLFNDTPDILATYQTQYQWVFIDEFQDINAKQFELIMLLVLGESSLADGLGGAEGIVGGADGAQRHQLQLQLQLATDGCLRPEELPLNSIPRPHLFAIGDPDQAIYGFRGSDVRLIQTLTARIPTITTLHLKKSFRCPDPIIQAAGQVLDKTEPLAGKTDAIQLKIQECATEKSESEWIAKTIEQLIGGVRSFSMDSGVSDGIAFDGITSFSDIAILVRTHLMMDELAHALHHHGIAYQIVGTDPFYHQEPFSILLEKFKEIYLENAPIQDCFKAVSTAIRQNLPISESILPLVVYYQLSKSDQKRLLQFTNSYGADYTLFFQDMLLRKGQDEFDNHIEAVSLMTLHAAKGLEFSAVFIPGCEEGLIPFELFGTSTPAQILEEARLFYVGLTRTKRYLYLSYAKKRFLKGRVLTPQKSRFLNKIQDDLFIFQGLEQKSTSDRQLALF